MSESSCASCRFFKPGTGHAGTCQRYPPQVYGLVQSVGKGGEYHLDGIEEVAWPAVRPDDWCGEWAAQARAAAGGS